MAAVSRCRDTEAVPTFYLQKKTENWLLSQDRSVTERTGWRQTGNSDSNNLCCLGAIPLLEHVEITVCSHSASCRVRSSLFPLFDSIKTHTQGDRSLVTLLGTPFFLHCLQYIRQVGMSRRPAEVQT